MADEDEIADLAKMILMLSRNRLLINLRFMEPAFLGLASDPDLKNAMFSTEGQFLHYSPSHIVRMFSNERTEVTHAYLHTVLHCVYRHF